MNLEERIQELGLHYEVLSFFNARFKAKHESLLLKDYFKYRDYKEVVFKRYISIFYKVKI